jgi:sugar phosphate isomerase/epimerase
MSRDEEKRRLCPGEGIVDFTKYLKHSELAGVKHYIVENESCEDEHQMECMRGSYKYLSNLTF